MRLTSLAFGIGLSLVAACALRPSGAQDASASEVPAVVSLALRVPEGESALTAALERSRLLSFLRKTDRFRFTIGPNATGDVIVEIALLPVADEWKQRLERLPVRLTDDTIELAGTRYERPDHALAVRLPTAQGTRWLVVGRDPEVLVELAANVLLRGIGRRRDERPPFDYWLFETHDLSRVGSFVMRADGRRVVDLENDRDAIGDRDRAWAARAPIPGRYLTLRVPRSRRTDIAIHRLAADLDVFAGKVVAALGEDAGTPLDAWVEDDYVSLGRFLGEIAPAVTHRHDGKACVHAVPRPRDTFYLRFAVAAALIDRARLAADRPWLRDGAALWLSEDWYGRQYREWLPVFAAGRVLPSADELLATGRPRDATALLWAPAAAAVLDRLPGDDLRSKLVAAADEKAVAAALAAIAVLAEQAPPPTEPRPWDLPFQPGVSLARTPGVDAGYEAGGYAQVLDDVAALGVRALSLIPMAGQRAPDHPRLSFMNAPGDEHDVGMVEGAARAHAKGFTVLYKPHVYLGGSWPGEISMSSEEDWATWWASYRRFILHHAVLAAFAEVELFAVGTELGKTLEREAEWRHLTTSVRRIFPGRLTYAGNWWGDYDRVPFADQLDVLGVDAYFPLAGTADATDAELAAGAQKAVDQMAAVAQRLGKPLLLTEVGFSAHKGAWVAPNEEGGWRDPNALSVEDQRRAYAALLGALGRPDWLAGLYFWKVFSTPEEGDRPAADFVFLKRPAEKVIRDYLAGE